MNINILRFHNDIDFTDLEGHTRLRKLLRHFVKECFAALFC
jgi:hypothetical protein